MGETTIVITDSQYCVVGYRQGALKQQGTWNDDLWEAFFGQVERLQGQVVLVKVKSHLELLDAAHGLILLKDLTGNAIADNLAKKAADKAASTEKMSESIDIAKGTVHIILMHLVRANIEYLQQLESAGHRDPNQKRPVAKAPKKVRTPAHLGHEVRNIGKTKI